MQKIVKKEEVSGYESAEFKQLIQKNEENHQKRVCRNAFRKAVTFRNFCQRALFARGNFARRVLFALRRYLRRGGRLRKRADRYVFR